jgi:hypothetical protein
VGTMCRVDEGLRGTTMMTGTTDQSPGEASHQELVTRRSHSLGEDSHQEKPFIRRRQSPGETIH